MRISDWSSDVCSSDLAIPAPAPSSFVIQAGAGNIYEIIDAADTAVPPTVLASGPYVPGAWIPVNGFDVQLSGSLQPGDSFTVQPTPAGMADNGNIRALIDTRLGNHGFERSEAHTSELPSLMRISY